MTWHILYVAIHSVMAFRNRMQEIFLPSDALKYILNNNYGVLHIFNAKDKIRAKSVGNYNLDNEFCITTHLHLRYNSVVLLLLYTMNVKMNGIVPNIASKEIYYAIILYVNLDDNQKMFCYFLIQSRFYGNKYGYSCQKNVLLSISLQVAILSRRSQ